MINVESGKATVSPPVRVRKQTLLLTWTLLTALYAVLIVLHIGRHLWFDELLTYRLASAPSLSQLLYLVQKWDLNPPLLHLLAHASLALAQGNPAAVRYPSVLEFYGASLLLFYYSARKLGTAFAALPVLILWSSPLFVYATEARPYALLCFWFCALLLLWDRWASGDTRKLILAGVVVSSTGLLCSHVLAPLSLLPFAAAEVVRLRRRRQPDWRLWAALFLPLVVTISYLPLFAGYRKVTEYPAAFQAGPAKIASFYWHTLLGVLACLCFAALAAWLGGRTHKGRRIVFRADETALLAVLLSIPILLNLVMLSQHSPFWGRYCITSALGLYFLGAFAIAAPYGQSQRAGYAAVWSAGALVLFQQAALPLYRGHAEPAPENAAALEKIKPELPIVAASGLTFVEMGQYESRTLVSRLYYLRDYTAAVQFAQATIFEDLAEFQKDFRLPGTIEPYQRFVREHPVFLVYGTFDYPEDWLLRKLAADHAVIEPAGTFPSPYKDKTLFEVHVVRPGSKD